MTANYREVHVQSCVMVLLTQCIDNIYHNIAMKELVPKKHRQFDICLLTDSPTVLKKK